MAAYVAPGDRPDQILVLEHNPVFTLGRNATRQDIHVADGAQGEPVEPHAAPDREPSPVGSAALRDGATSGSARPSSR